MYSLEGDSKILKDRKGTTIIAKVGELVSGL